MFFCDEAVAGIHSDGTSVAAVAAAVRSDPPSSTVSSCPSQQHSSTWLRVPITVSQ